MAVVLEEVLAGDYEPSQEDIVEYANWLGMDLKEDQDLLWIAREGLKAPLPSEWKACQSDGDIFFFNFQTGESEWDHPSDVYCRKLYHSAKAERDQPVRVVTIEGTLDEELGVLTARCSGSFTGEQVALLELEPSVKVPLFWSELAKQLDVPETKLKIMMSDDRLLSQGDDDDISTLASVLGIVCTSSDQGQVAGSQGEHSRL
jgi:centrosomal protein CEP164